MGGVNHFPPLVGASDSAARTFLQPTHSCLCVSVRVCACVCGLVLAPVSPAARHEARPALSSSPSLSVLLVLVLVVAPHRAACSVPATPATSCPTSTVAHSVSLSLRCRRAAPCSRYGCRAAATLFTPPLRPVSSTCVHKCSIPCALHCCRRGRCRHRCPRVAAAAR